MSGTYPSPPPLTPEEIAQLPHDDRGQTLYGISWFLTALATTLLGLRVYCKFLGHRALWWDDWILLASWVLLVVDSALVTSLVLDYGFGKHSWDFDFAPPGVDRFFLVVNVRATITVTAIVWTKTAFAMTLLRLSDGWMRRLLYIAIASMNTAMGLSAFLNWVQCKPIAKSWTPTMDGTCWDQSILIKYSIFSGAYSGAMDFLLALLPWRLLWGLQMRKKEKAGLAIAMSMGLFSGTVAIVKTTKIPELASGDLYNAADLVLWDVTETAVTMMAACIPVLRILLRDVRASTRRYTLSHERSRTAGSRLAAVHTWNGGSGGTSNKNSRAAASAYSSFQKADNQSDKSILGSGLILQKPGRIQRTEEVSVEYGDAYPRKPDAYELKDFP